MQNEEVKPFLHSSFELRTSHFYLTMRKLLLAALLAATALPAAALPFIEDDYSKAVARARAKNIPIFADAWAPW